MSKIVIDNQPVFERIINKINDYSASAQAYLLVGMQKNDLERYSILLAKTLICPHKYFMNCDKCNICKRIDDGNFAELKIISPDGKMIKKEVILNLRNSLQTSSIEGRNQVYIINEAQNLNSSAANSLLKFLEEPDSNTVAIFTSTNLDMVINTIVSRCQIVKINNIKSNTGIDIVCEVSGLDIDKVNEIILIFLKLEKDPTTILSDINNVLLKNYNTRELIISFLNVLVLLYDDLLNYKFFGHLKYFKNNEKLIDIAKNIDTQKIVRKVSFILENLEKLDYNVNILLFINNLLIGIGEIDDDKNNRN